MASFKTACSTSLALLVVSMYNLKRFGINLFQLQLKNLLEAVSHLVNNDKERLVENKVRRIISKNETLSSPGISLCYLTAMLINMLAT